VYDRGTFSNSFIGKELISLPSLGTQQEVKKWFPLHGENYDSEERTGMIRLKIQWIYSRLELMGEKVAAMQRILNDIEAISKAHKREMNIFKSPFASLLTDKYMFKDGDDPDILVSIYEAHPKELKASKKIDRLVRPIKEKTGLGEMLWPCIFGLAYFIYFLLTVS
jgi:hypothetical protein